MPEKELKTPVAAGLHATGTDILIGKTLLEIDLAAVLGVSKATVANLRYKGKIPYVKISNGKPIYLVDSILEWLKAKEIKEGMVVFDEQEFTPENTEQAQGRANRPDGEKTWGNGRTADDIDD